jgi:hypothetical protein
MANDWQKHRDLGQEKHDSHKIGEKTARQESAKQII